MATHLVDNGGDLDSLAAQVDTIWEDLLTRASRPFPNPRSRNNRRTPAVSIGTMPALELVTDLTPAGDQPEAIAALAEGIERGDRFQTLLGITGSGKSFTTAAVIEKVQRPDARARPQQDARRAARQRVPGAVPEEPGGVLRLLLRLLPARGVPADAPTPTSRRTRRSTTRSTGSATPPPARSMSRRDVIIVASVSAIYGLGGPEEYARQCLILDVGEEREQRLDPRPARRAAVRTQRLRLRPQQVPRPGRHHRGVPGLRGARGAHLAVRRRGGAHRVGRPAHRRDRRGARAPGAVPGVALRHLRRAHEARHRGHRGRAGRAAGVVREEGQAARGAAVAHAHDVRPRDAARDRRVLRDRELLAPPRRSCRRARCPTRCSTISPTTSWSWSTSRTRPCRSSTASTRATSRARTRWSITGSGSRRPWTTARCASTSSSTR